MVSELQNGNNKTLSQVRVALLSTGSCATTQLIPPRSRPWLGGLVLQGGTGARRAAVLPHQEGSRVLRVLGCAWSWCRFARHVPGMAGPGVGVYEPARTQSSSPMFWKLRRRSQWLNLEQVKSSLLQSNLVSNRSKGSDAHRVWKRAFRILTGVKFLS